jgi:hypothetical protein
MTLRAGLLLLPPLVLAAHCTNAPATIVERQQQEQSQYTHFPQPGTCGASNGYVDGTQDCSAGQACVAYYTMLSSLTVQGRCASGRCDYDACLGDTGCPGGQACICMSDTHAPGNTCVATQCLVDGDCGAGGICSPSTGGAPFYGIVGRFCRTPNDTCVLDSECKDPTQGAGVCFFDPTVGRWACSYDHAAG